MTQPLLSQTAAISKLSKYLYTAGTISTILGTGMVAVELLFLDNKTDTLFTSASNSRLEVWICLMLTGVVALLIANYIHPEESEVVQEDPERHEDNLLMAIGP